MNTKEIETYINTYRVYPDEYTGVRDTKILNSMERSYTYDPRNQMITQLRGRINKKGNFEIVGPVTFPVGKPELSTPLDTLNIARVVTYYNRLMDDLGFPGSKISSYNPGTKNWTLRDMVAEMDSVRRSLYKVDHERANADTLTEDPEVFENAFKRSSFFVWKYQKCIDGIKAYTKHGSQFDE